MFDLDIEGNDYYHNIKYGSGIFSLNMMQTIGNNFVAGFELFNIIPRRMSLLSYGARYTSQRNKFYG